MAEEIEITALHSFYRSLSELVGTEAMLEVYRHYRGIQVSIPVHLYDRNLSAGVNGVHGDQSAGLGPEVRLQ
nr:hypothetical protein [Lactiplantibacillus plantarum]